MENYHYKVDINWSEEDQTFIAKVPELGGVITHGSTVSEAAQMAEEAIDLHVKSMAKIGQKIPAPAAMKKTSGSMSLRMGSDRHRNALIRVADVGAKSLNDYICNLIDKDLGPERSFTKVEVIQMLGKMLKEEGMTLERKAKPRVNLPGFRPPQGRAMPVAKKKA